MPLKPKAIKKAAPREPFVRRWIQPQSPMYVRVIRAKARTSNPFQFFEGRPWLTSSPPEGVFNFSTHVHQLCQDIVRICPEFKHIDMNRILITVTQARNNNRHGFQARVTPLRFPGGALTQQFRGVTYQVQRYFLGDAEFLYVLTFCLPRFINQDFESKLITVFHELYHISPKFDGDLRRHEGRYAFHTHSQRNYDELMTKLARQYLSNGANPAAYEFLRLNFTQLEKRHGKVVGNSVPRPKIVPRIR